MTINIRKCGQLICCFSAKTYRLAMVAIRQWLTHNCEWPPAYTVEIVRDNNILHKMILVEDSEPYLLY